MKVITIGRSTENNDIVVNDEKVSRNHLQMVMDDNGNYSVVDLGSTNGTFVNGQRISGEVRLQPNDEVRIGQTVLPWQSYFAGVQASNQQLQPLTNSSSHNNAYTPKPRPLWVYVVVGVIALLLIGGGIGWKLYNDKQERIAQEQKDKDSEAAQEKAKEEAEKARDAASKANEEYQNAMRRAAESQSEEDKRAAEVAARKAEEANKLAQQKEAEWKNMKAALDAANKAKEEAVEQSEKDKEDKEKAIQEARDAQNVAKKAEEAKQKVEKEAELTKKFYRQIAEVKPKIAFWDTDYYQKICDKMGWKPSSDENKKDYIIEMFEKANDDEKQKIIYAVEQVLRIQKNEAPNVDPVDEIKNPPKTDSDVTPNDTTVKGQ